MNTISNMLHNGNLTPRERFLLLIQNDIERTKTGKEILTPADKEALENWNAKDSSEVREWNRLNEGWKYSGRMEIESEFIFQDAKASYLAQLPWIMKLMNYPTEKKIQEYVSILKQLKKVSLHEATQIADKQREIKLKDGMDFNHVAYKLSFELISAKDKKRLNELYPDIETDEEYLEQEEIIANLLDGKQELTQKAKIRLSKLVAEQSYNTYAKEYQLFHYFACLPLVEIGRRFLKSKNIEITQQGENREEEEESSSNEVTKALEGYASKYGKTIHELMEEGTLIALNENILDDYTPLVISSDAKLFRRWLSKKIEAKSILLQHVKQGELMLQERTKQEIYNGKLYTKDLYHKEIQTARNVLENMGLECAIQNECDEKTGCEDCDEAIITGESLYGLKADYGFLKTFKKRIDTYEPNLGIVYEDEDMESKGPHLDREFMICNLAKKGEASVFSLYGMAIRMLSALTEGDAFFKETAEGGKSFISFKDVELEEVFRSRRNDLISGYAKLLAFEEVFKRLSREYDADLTYHIADRIKILRDYIERVNEAVRIATNTEEQLKKSEAMIFRRKEVLEFKEGLIIDIDTIKPDIKVVEEHEEKLTGILGSW